MLLETVDNRCQLNAYSADQNEMSTMWSIPFTGLLLNTVFRG